MTTTLAAENAASRGASSEASDHREPIELRQLIDVERYPLDGRDAAAVRPRKHAGVLGDRLSKPVQRPASRPVAHCLKDFVTPERRAPAQRRDRGCEAADALLVAGHQPLFPHPGRTLSSADDHPVNAFTERSSGFIPGDAWPSGVRHGHAVPGTPGLPPAGRLPRDRRAALLRRSAGGPDGQHLGSRVSSSRGTSTPTISR